MNNKMFKWETKIEYEYRLETGKLTTSIANALNSMEEIATSGNLDYSKISDTLYNCYRNIKYIISPSIYEEAHKYLFEAIKIYKRGIEILVVAVEKKDAKGMYKANRFIEEGNCFIKITKVRLWESIEKRNEELKNDKPGNL